MYTEWQQERQERCDPIQTTQKELYTCFEVADSNK